MNLKINGNQIEVPASVKTVAELLTHLELDNRIVVVERNKDILQKDDHTDTSVFDGDQIEIVTFVGGG
ncbi:MULTISPECIES: sulfur carrier protein ThiS [Bacillus]|uniref:ThiS protein n=27 Tax=Bacillus cereus group TaxID=86661 RepID=Q81HQ6_BACCR|nr:MULTISPECIES: sulfur carrier protein ThiS [Bacillus]ANN30979.1 thiamine biosynthesis protein ThiS [Bacillus thuringiensis serovar coreanensis]EAO52257.1 ThiS protein [Bacillus thuringiensis serovar israelensis ATCC 35646]MBR3338314.1 thiamine biosynthesis protein ThiS [Bacillus sp. (in: firmicutes)]MCO4217447.1 sulfur carrier protein ThiS [Bacillus sp. 10017]MCU7388114.1 sulfur carrier protein ThiS [Bacillus sp. ST24]MCX2703769.1 sulfur carrier protein ThiS [Bacillus sp. AS_5]MCZ2990574.1